MQVLAAVIRISFVNIYSNLRERERERIKMPLQKMEIPPYRPRSQRPPAEVPVASNQPVIDPGGNRAQSTSIQDSSGARIHSAHKLQELALENPSMRREDAQENPFMKRVEPPPPPLPPRPPPVPNTIPKAAPSLPPPMPKPPAHETKDKKPSHEKKVEAKEVPKPESKKESVKKEPPPKKDSKKDSKIDTKKKPGADGILLMFYLVASYHCLKFVGQQRYDAQE